MCLSYSRKEIHDNEHSYGNSVAVSVPGQKFESHDCETDMQIISSMTGKLPLREKEIHDLQNSEPRDDE